MFEISEEELTSREKEKMQGFAILCRMLHNNATDPKGHPPMLSS
jgi:hypothetical protein